MWRAHEDRLPSHAVLESHGPRRHANHRRGDRRRGRRLADGLRVGVDRPALDLASHGVAAAGSDARPPPPLEMGAQSDGATRRAARLTDGVFFGPQVAWRDIAKLAEVFREARAASGQPGSGSIGASRSLIVGTDKEAARAAAREYLEKPFTMYRTWEMQEKGMATLQLSSDIALDDWTVYGSPRDCVETLKRGREMGLDKIGFSIYSLPREVQARIDYLQMIAEQILRPAGAL